MSVVRIGLCAAILALLPFSAQAQIFSSGSGGGAGGGGGGDARAGAKAFAADCTACHRSSAGLAKNTGASGLVSFLRQHYTTSAQRRGDIAAYILSSGGQSGQAQLRRGREGAAPEIAGEGDAKPEDARGSRRRGEAEAARQPQGAGNQPQAGAEDAAQQQQQLDKRAAARAERQKRRAQREAAKQEAAKQEAAKQEALKQQAAREEAERQEAARQEAARQEAARQEAARQEAARQEAARQEAARHEAARQEAARREAARQDAARQEAARQEAARQVAVRQAAEPREAAGQEADEPEQLGFPQGRRLFSETAPNGDRDRNADESSVRADSKDGGESSLISSTIKAPEPAFGASAGVRSRLNINGGAARATDAPEGAVTR